MNPIGAALAISSAILAGATAALAWAPDAQVQRELVSGASWAEVLPSADGAGVIHAAIDIAAPPRTVWAVMTDCGMASRLVVSVTSCTVVQGDQRAGWDIREQVTRGNFFVPVIHNVFRSDYQPYSLIRFHRLGGDPSGSRKANGDCRRSTAAPAPPRSPTSTASRPTSSPRPSWFAPPCRRIRPRFFSTCAAKAKPRPGEPTAPSRPYGAARSPARASPGRRR